MHKQTEQVKDLKTTIAVKRLEMKQLEKELSKLESESREELAKRFGVE